jgi:hypothetical protein
MIFVFGSNEAGVHGAGAALYAVMQGATRGMGFGPSGNTFAIPTKDWRIETLPLAAIEAYVQRFIVYARFNPKHIFQVTRIGCGLAGFPDGAIAPLFKYAPDNCCFDSEW